MGRVLWLVIAWMMAGQVAAAAPRIAEPTLVESSGRAQLVFPLAGPVAYHAFELGDPPRLVVDVAAGGADLRPVKREFNHPVLRSVRMGVRAGRDARLVLDLAARGPIHIQLMPPGAQAGYRLVIDLPPAVPALQLVSAPGRPEATLPALELVSVSQAGAPVAPPAVPTPVTRPVVPAVPEPVVQPVAAPRSARAARTARDVVIAIDPGHGGQDPGAIGARGTREKDVVLAVAKRLQSLVDAEPGMRAVMTRVDDRYLKLRQRIDLARGAGADVFVSVHADAFNDPKARGASVWVVSDQGASSEAARWLANQENAADLVGGVSLAARDDAVASVVLDLTQDVTREGGAHLAALIHRELRKVGVVHKGQVERAAFAVLKAPDIPSVLVETAFITNPQEEAQLLDAGYQQRLAEAVLAGLRGYVRDRLPPQLLMAQAEEAEGETTRHVIRRGDTLSTIARRYQVALARLRSANGITDDRLRVGEVLTIPVSEG